MKQLFYRYEKYLPYNDYDVNSEESVMAVLKKQCELIESKRLMLTQNASNWMHTGADIEINKIFQDRLTPYHNHDYYEINYVFEDSLVQFVEGTEIVMHKGDLLLLSPKVRHTSFPVGEKNDSRNIIITEKFVKETEKKLAVYNTSNYLNFLMNNNAYILFVNTAEYGIDKMIRELMTIDDGKKRLYNVLLKNNLAEKLLATLADCDRYDRIFKDNRLIGNAKEREEHILHYMYEHYATITLEELADKFGYSQQQIRRIIKKNTGFSFITALQLQRMNKAMNLLETTNLSIKEIAKIIGLDSPEYFSRRFKHERGISPMEHRNSYLSQNANKQETKA